MTGWRASFMGNASNGTECQSQGHRKQVTGTLYSGHRIPESAWVPESDRLNSNLKAIIYRALDKFLNCSVLVSSSMKQENDSASWCRTLLELQVKRSLLLQVLSRYLTIGSHKDLCWILNHLLELLNSPTLTWSWVRPNSQTLTLNCGNKCTTSNFWLGGLMSESSLQPLSRLQENFAIAVVCVSTL